MAANRRLKTGGQINLVISLRRAAIWLSGLESRANLQPPRFAFTQNPGERDRVVRSSTEALVSGNRQKEAETGGVLCSRISWSRCRLGARCEGPAQGRKVHCRISTSLTDVTRIAPYEVLHEAQSVLLFRRACCADAPRSGSSPNRPECVRAACRRSGDVSLSFVGP